MRFYRWLLWLYPESFRAEYESEMCAVFARKRRDASPPFALLALWISAFAETLWNAVAAHWDILRQDLRYAVRTLSRTPWFTLTAIAIVALGVGANTAAFSVTDFVLIRPLPFPQPDQLVKIWESVPGYSQMELSPGNYRDWKNRSSSFEGFGMYATAPLNWSGDGDPERLEAVAVSANLLPTLGATPIVGRLFSGVDDSPGAAKTVLLSYRLWQARFGGDPAAVGRKMILDGAPNTIIGVMPPEFRFPSSEAEIWQPMALSEALYQDRANNFVTGIARLKPGVSLQRAREELNSIAAQLEREFPRENEHTRATVLRLSDVVSQQSRLLLTALSGAALCVLLIACANLANLLLARGIERRKELAVRTAIGAGRERLLRQMITESMILAGIGGAIGVLLANAAVPLMTRLVPATLPIADTPAIDLRVLLFAALLTVLTGLAFGAWPAWRVGRGLDLNGLREDARSGGGRRERLRAMLVMAEVTASVVLLVSAGLLVRALLRVQETDPGFRAENVLTMRTSLPPRYATVALRTRFYTEVLTNVRRLPGVVNAAYITFLPMGELRGGIWPVEIGGVTVTRAAGNTASLRFITPGFFATMRIPLQQGRDVAESDMASTSYTAVVSRSFARRYWPTGNAIGQHFKFAFHDRTITGIVGDIRVRGLERESEPQVYIPYKQTEDNNLPFYAPKALVIRSAGSSESLISAVCGIIRGADPEQPITDVQTMERIVDGETATRSVQARLLAGFAALAFLLAAVGIHGLLAFAVSQRLREIGVRMAMGAKPRDILAMVIRQSALVTLVGVIPGALLAYAAARAMQALLAGVRPDDASTFAAAIALCVAMTLIGSWIPAWRAVRVDPIMALRAE
jgi:putative ABC transport system permease protein